MTPFSFPVLQCDMEEIFLRSKDWADFKDKTILITGAYGMIASYLTLYFIWLNEEHHQNITIIAAVRSEEKARNRFGDFCSRDYFHFYTDDIAKQFVWNGQIDFIIHAAGIADPKQYGVYPAEVAEANAIGTYQLLRWAQRYPIKSFLLFSSGDVYGKMVQVESITEDMMGVTDPLDIHSCYGESKRMAETWCMSFAKEYNIETKIARICHTYSPFVDIENDPRVFSSFVRCLVEGKDIEILSDGTAKRPFCYITDAVVAFLLVLIKGDSGEAYNVSNEDQFLTVLELAETIASLSDRPTRVIIRGKRTDGYLENVDNHANCPISAKLQRLGWTHEVSVRDGFHRVVQYIQDGAKMRDVTMS